MDAEDKNAGGVSRREFLKVAGAAGAFAFVAGAVPAFVWADDKAGPDLARLGDLIHPYDVAFAPDGTLYVANAGRYGVVKLPLGGAAAYVGDGPGTAPGKLNFPMGVAVAAGGNLYVADTNNGRVQVFDGAGAYVRDFGRLGYLDGEFHRPKSVCAYKTGVLVADTRNHRIQYVDLASERLVTRAPVTRAIYGGLGDGPSDLKLPRYVAADLNGDIYVADAGHGVVKVYDDAGAVKRVLGQGRFNEPAGIAVADDGRVFVADAGAAKVLAFGQGGAFAGDVAGLPSLKKPRGVALYDGALYVADADAGKVAFARV